MRSGLIVLGDLSSLVARLVDAAAHDGGSLGVVLGQVGVGLNDWQDRASPLLQTQLFVLRASDAADSGFTDAGLFAILAAEPPVIGRITRTEADGLFAVGHGVVPVLDGVVSARKQVERSCVFAGRTEMRMSSSMFPDAICLLTCGGRPWQWQHSRVPRGAGSQSYGTRLVIRSGSLPGYRRAAVAC